VLADLTLLFLAGSATALATGLGALPVAALGGHAEAWRPTLVGFAAGVMIVASLVGLLLPAVDDGSAWEVAAGLGAGVAFLVATRAALTHRRSGATELRNVSGRRAALVFAVLFVHSLPEGLAIGSAYASGTAGLGLFVILAIALQNVPEGTSVAIPMQQAGAGGAAQFWAAVGTSAPQPFGAILAYVVVEEVDGLLPVSFAFAAGAMLSLVLVELLPEALARGRRAVGSAGVLAGALIMLALSAALGV
jgi:ZIP family zinc transporter